MSRIRWQITNATLVEADSSRRASGLLLSGGKIERELAPAESEDNLLTLNLHGLFVFPGWINGHDSLIASYLPFKGERAPYLNWLAWDTELKSSALFKERMFLEVSDLYRLGAYRNLISGATTVVDHIPEFVRGPFVGKLPVELLADYGISHSICSYDLRWGDGPRREYERAEKLDLAYITHIAEGFDPESRQSLARLDEMGALGERSVLVHGLALSESDLDRIAERKASLVWCPAANLHIYGKTAPVERALQRGINVVLGSDAAMYGSQNLLQDVHAASGYFQSQLGQDLDPAQLLAMVTVNAARAFRLKDRGQLRSGARADLVVLRGKRPQDALASFVTAELDEIYLVIRNGQPVYGEETLEKAFTEHGLTFDRITVRGSRKLIQRGFREAIEKANKTLGRRVNFSFLPAELAQG
ncbi:MAG: amidohydrolase family protein [Leptospirales bacterium]|nr:amidohydrolase family protein [Leptospirales bacterium]